MLLTVQDVSPNGGSPYLVLSRVEGGPVFCDHPSLQRTNLVPIHNQHPRKGHGIGDLWPSSVFTPACHPRRSGCCVCGTSRDFCGAVATSLRPSCPVCSFAGDPDRNLLFLDGLRLCNGRMGMDSRSCVALSENFSDIVNFICATGVD